MNKEQFLSELSGCLNTLSESELNRTVEYYAEMIDDRIEEGLTEEDAVSALGDVQAIAREIMQELPARAAESAAAESADPSDAPSRQIFTGELRRLRLDSKGADFVVRGAELPDGACCIAENAHSMRCCLENGTLTVCDPEESGGTRRFWEKLFSIRTEPKHPVTLLLPARARCEVEISSRSGDVQLEEISLDGGVCVESLSGDISASCLSASGEATLKSVSGDITLSECRALRLSLNTASGDVQLRQSDSETGVCAASISGDVTVEGSSEVDEMVCQSSSGDLRLSNVAAEQLTASSTSGDVSVRNAVARIDMDLGSVSGDVSVADSEARERLKLHSTSGDIRLRGASAAHLTLESHSGDVSGSLRGPKTLYDFRCRSRSGSVRVPDSRGERPVEAHTFSGDIRLKAE